MKTEMNEARCRHGRNCTGSAWPRRPSLRDVPDGKTEPGARKSPAGSLRGVIISPFQSGSYRALARRGPVARHLCRS
ncbi:hypothetical protein RR42_m0962 [Cupriavidus basilensis]|uniref:Uncharacterized protein n=1 Tax=Cupriavidus basilensis TaxID=68895 RepID=A0A0C4Y625_9BURK|nr:hypothetical protein RR42_m0962 [Cupriavidus basilensis]